MRKRAAASSGRQDAESGGWGMERRGKDGFFGRWVEVWAEEEEWRRRRREKGRKKNCCSFIAVAVAPVRPPPKKTTFAGCSADRPSKPQKGRTPPKWVLLQSRDSPFIPILPFFPFSPREGVPRLHPVYKRLYGSLQRFFYSGKKEDMSVRR